MCHQMDYRGRPKPETAGQNHETHLGHRGVRQGTFDVRLHQHDEGAVDHGGGTGHDCQYPRRVIGSQRSQPDQQDPAGIHHSGMKER